MAKTVIGLMDTGQEAEAVVRDLTSTCGCSREDIGLAARREGSSSITHESASGEEMATGALTGAGTGAAVGGVLGLLAGTAALAIPGIGPIIAAGPIAATLAGAGIGAAAGGLIGALINAGVPEDEAQYYMEGVKRGGTLITLHARDDRTADCALRVMREHGAVDIRQRAQQWQREGWTGRSSEEGVIPVAKEELAVGKREVSKGDVHVRTRTEQRPAQETVNLREEHAKVERRPVDRPLAAGDDAFKERDIEVSETAEEPVVGKRARVTEEVRVGKQTSEWQETVRENVRETKVDVQRGANSGYSGPERRRRQGSSSYKGAERRAAMGR